MIIIKEVIEMFEKVEGSNNAHKIRCFTLSTCVWCKRTKAWLREMGYEFEYADMDLAEGEKKAKLKEVILSSRWKKNYGRRFRN